MVSAFDDYFRCRPGDARIRARDVTKGAPGYFRLRDRTYFGRCADARPSCAPAGPSPDVTHLLAAADGNVTLPFDLGEVIDNLRLERYRAPQSGLSGLASLRIVDRAYYAVRPMLGVAVRKHLQRLRLRDWRDISFPQWPVDLSVDGLMREVMRSLVHARGGEPVPFIWFWPAGAEGCVVMTHDVEGETGRAFCDALADMDEAHTLRAAFQLVPTQQTEGARALAAALRARGHEVNVHDLYHDGSLFRDRESFDAQVTEINRYAKDSGAHGFRSGALYRRQDWYDAFTSFSYDMSVPNVAHLDPQRGGCCTVTPYFIGDLLELPVTTIQDYSLFHVVGDYSTTLWEQQIALILENHGLVSFIVHPDYLVESRARAVYASLLEHLDAVRADRHVWTALPGDVNRWWRDRSEMMLVERDGTWSIEGPDHGRARVAFASIENDRLVYRQQAA